MPKVQIKHRKKLTEVSNYKISQPHCITDAVRCKEREWQDGNLLGLLGLHI